MMRQLSEYFQQGGVNKLPLKLESLQSTFIVFRKPIEVRGAMNTNFPEHKMVTTIVFPWEVTFDVNMCGSGKSVVFEALIDWTKRQDENIKHYFGTVIYNN